MSAGDSGGDICIVIKSRELTFISHYCACILPLKNIQVYINDTESTGKSRVRMNNGPATGRQKHNESEISLLIRELSVGITLVRVIRDAMNIPVDYVYLYLNNEAVKTTGARLTVDKIIDRRATEIFPYIKKSTRDWVKIFGEVAETGLSMEFEHYSTSLNRWLSVKVFRLKEEQVVAEDRDITKYKRDILHARHEHEKMLPSLGDYADNRMIDFHYVYEPMIDVGGDIITVRERGDGLNVFIADVAGHGRSAAVHTSLLKVGFEEVEKDASIPINQAFDRLNTTLMRTFRYIGTTQFVAATYCRFEPNPGGGVDFQWVCAGHPYHVLYRKKTDTLVLLESSGMLLGIHDDVTYELFTLDYPLEKGDRIFLFTDGLPETHTGPEELLIDRPDWLTVLFGAKKDTISEAVTDIMQRLRKMEYRGNDREGDDIVLAGFEVK